jgi:hypothetical protein
LACADRSTDRATKMTQTRIDRKCRDYGIDPAANCDCLVAALSVVAPFVVFNGQKRVVWNDAQLRFDTPPD